MNYNKYLTVEERAQCLKFGAQLKCAEYNTTPEQLLKASADWYDAPATMMKTVAALALVTGIPIGIAAHAIGKHVNTERTKEKELKEQIKYYKNTVGGLQSGLQADAVSQM